MRFPPSTRIVVGLCCFTFTLASLSSVASAAEAGGLDLSDLEADSAALTPAQQQQLEVMRSDSRKIEGLAARLSADRLAEAWRRYLVTYAEDIPGTLEDDALRAKAERAAQLPAAAVAVKAESPVPTAALPPRLVEHIAAYRAAKKVDISAAPVADKVAAWQGFLAAHADDVPGTTIDNDQRLRATARLKHWSAPASTTPAGNLP